MTLEETSEKNKIDTRRDTNLELFRIITMLLIVAHHYVVNSGLMNETGPVLTNPTSIKSNFLLLFGAWGKIGINCFVLITGYFMCKSTITLKKFVKLLMEVMFYRIVISSIFWICGYSEFGLSALAKTILPIKSIASGFTDAYLVFFLLIPFVNILIHNITKKQHFYLLLLLTATYVFMGTFNFVFSVTMNYVSWFIVLYLLASYVRLYPTKICDNTKWWGWISIVLVTICCLSVIACTWVGTKIGKVTPYYFVTDSNTFLAIATGFSAFMFFKNVKIKYNPFINSVALTCFGVLQIHANSDTMRQWLWGNLLNNVEAYYETWMPIYAILSVFFIFTICSGIDYLRICLLERPFFKVWDKYEGKIIDVYKRLEKKIIK